jgi:hypothetical protein
VEGTLQNPGGGDPLEYQVLMEVKDDTGKLLSRQIIGVGALHASEKTRFLGARRDVERESRQLSPPAGTRTSSQTATLHFFR